MALSDGAHAYGNSLLSKTIEAQCVNRSTEDFSYFTLRRNATTKGPARSVFGISCTRQIDSNNLIDRPADVTRSTVQKAVVVIADGPQSFGHIREKLSIVTGAWFAQRLVNEGNGRVLQADCHAGTSPTWTY